MQLLARRLFANETFQKVASCRMGRVALVAGTCAYFKQNDKPFSQYFFIFFFYFFRIYTSVFTASPNMFP